MISKKYRSLGNWSLLTSYEQTHSFYVLLYCRTVNQSLEKSSDSEINFDTGHVLFSNWLINIWDTITQIKKIKNGHHGISICLNWNETNIPIILEYVYNLIIYGELLLKWYFICIVMVRLVDRMRSIRLSKTGQLYHVIL